MSEHTPTPYEYRPTFTEHDSGKRVLCVYGPHNYTRRIIFVKENPDAEDEATGQFIVRACNAHKDLVEACRKALSCQASMNSAVVQLIGDALAKAKPQKNPGSP